MWFWRRNGFCGRRDGGLGEVRIGGFLVMGGDGERCAGCLLLMYLAIKICGAGGGC